MSVRSWTAAWLLAVGAVGCAGLIGADFDRSLEDGAADDEGDDDSPGKDRDAGGSDDDDTDAGDDDTSDAAPSAVECGDMGGLDPDASWPMGGYCPARTSQGRGRALKGPKILWRFDLSDPSHSFRSTPSIAADGTLFTTAYLGVDGGGLVFALLGIKDRKETFRAALPGNGAPSTPVLVRNGTVVVQTLGAVTSFTRTGAVQRTHPTSATTFGEPAVLGDGSLVVPVDDAVMFVSESGGLTTRVKPEFGASFSFVHSATISPTGKIFAVARPNGGSSLDGRLVAFNTTRQLLFPTPVVLNGSPTTSPAIDPKGNVVVHTTKGIAVYSDTGALLDYKQSSVDPKAPFLARSGNAFWYAQEGPGGPVSYDAVTHAIVTHPEDGIFSPFAAAKDGSLLVVRRDTFATPPQALIGKAPDGTERWKVAIDSSPEDVLAPAVDKDGTIYVVLGPTLYAIGVTN